MKHLRLSLVCLVTLSLFAGAAIFVLLVMVPFWQAIIGNSVMNWFRDYGHVIGRAMLPLEVLPLILCAVLYFRVRKDNVAAGRAWLTVTAINVVILALFFFYFLPVNVAFIKGTMTQMQAEVEMDTWEGVHTFRTILCVAAIAFAGRGVQNLVNAK